MSNKLLFIVGISLILFSIFLVVPFASAGLNVVSPSSNVNISDIHRGIINTSGIGNQSIFNATLVNGTVAGTDIIIFNGSTVTQTNISFFAQNSTGSFLIGVSSTCANIGNASEAISNNISCWGNFSTSGVISDGQYNITAMANNNTPTVTINSTVNTTAIIDNTPPRVEIANFSAPLSQGRNYSSSYGNGLLVLNISVVDATAGIREVIFNITNGSRTLNASYNFTAGALQRQGDFYNISINTTYFPDGNYTLTVITNDTAGNVNNSAAISINFDNTVPRIETSNFSSPLNGNNYSASIGNGNLSINFPVIDLTAGVNQTSIVINITNASGIQNATYNITSLNGNFFNITINTRHFPDGNYTVLVYVRDTANNSNNSAQAVTYFDNTPPRIETGNFSSPSSGSNYSASIGNGNLSINFSVIDLTAGVNQTSIVINITNASGIQNATYNITSLNGNFFNITINTRHFPDGNYTVLVYVRDTANNSNNSAQAV